MKVFIFLLTCILINSSSATSKRGPNLIPCRCYCLGTYETVEAESICNQKGICACRKNVIGKNCNACKPNYWNIKSGKGCVPCNCDKEGSVEKSSCDEDTGRCKCKPGHSSYTCATCKENWYKNNKNLCQPCNCHPFGSKFLQCDAETGNCSCHKNAQGPKCDQCNLLSYNIQESCLDCPSCYKIIQTEIDNFNKVLLSVQDSLSNLPEATQDHEKFLKELNGLKESIHQLYADTLSKPPKEDVLKIKEKLHHIKNSTKTFLKRLGTVSLKTLKDAFKEVDRKYNNTLKTYKNALKLYIIDKTIIEAYKNLEDAVNVIYQNSYPICDGNINEHQKYSKISQLGEEYSASKKEQLLLIDKTEVAHNLAITTLNEAKKQSEIAQKLTLPSFEIFLNFSIAEKHVEELLEKVNNVSKTRHLEAFLTDPLLERFFLNIANGTSTPQDLSEVHLWKQQAEDAIKRLEEVVQESEKFYKDLKELILLLEQAEILSEQIKKFMAIAMEVNATVSDTLSTIEDLRKLKKRAEDFMAKLEELSNEIIKRQKDAQTLEERIFKFLEEEVKEVVFELDDLERFLKKVNRDLDYLEQQVSLGEYLFAQRDYYIQEVERIKLIHDSLPPPVNVNCGPSIEPKK